ncbi:MAG: hypothetical protein AB7S86_00725 [Hydrogenophaga sp.]|uniref:hypothetical protein n=1 Tax=Hydrogenophaga sp. TaxID=1904254 RepID=UPI003D0F0139
MGIYMVRAFVPLRLAASLHADLAQRVAELEERTRRLEISHDTGSRNARNQLRQMLDAIRELTVPPEPAKRPIGFATQENNRAPRQAAARSEPEPTSQIPHEEVFHSSKAAMAIWPCLMRKSMPLNFALDFPYRLTANLRFWYLTSGSVQDASPRRWLASWL